MSSINLVGQEGMTLVEYLGGNAGTQTWHSPITHTRYVFGGKRKLGFVDNRDVQWITTTFWEGDKPLFRVGKTQPAELVVDPKEASEVNPTAPGGPVIGDAALNPPIAETAVVEVAAPGEVNPTAPDAPEPEVTGEVVSEPPAEVVVEAVPPFDPKAMNITDLKKQLGSQPYSLPELQALLTAENADSPRSGAVSAIEAAIAAAGG